MRASISYSEISAFLNKSLDMSFGISYLSGDLIRVRFVPHRLIGQISVDLRFYLGENEELTLLVDSGSPGVKEILSGLMTMMKTRPNVFPYIRFDFPYVRVSFNAIPQLKAVLGAVALSDLVATTSGLGLSINI